ncbi:IS110 family transposase [Massilia sp. PAMC28688]|uniref:IS110 family transposase n=1 Tax=Massilia sp. PAMC28688 TaxID=2861283 RepID=UPI001C6371D1|nr:IS110 family transposase [Massilia sp. PAMC28688]QYF94839.1 IS110 family transposase [Massilia sp. PAMC28688]
METELQVAIDVGSRVHRVAVGDADGDILDQFDVHHTARGMDTFFDRIEVLSHGPVAVAMEGYNGWARPLDQRILARGWQLFNVNNLKLARYKEIFPAPAKSDNIDSLRILELFRARQSLHVARDVLQLVVAAPPENDKLKQFTRRRRQLVNDKIRIIARMSGTLQALCPGLLALTGAVDNVWFLSLLTARTDMRKLPGLRLTTLRGLPGVGKKYAALIKTWQQEARLADDVQWVGPMLYSDAMRLLALRREIKELERQIAAISVESELARRIESIPGFGLVCGAELAGEIGALGRFESEAGLAVYIGMAPLTNSSGTYQGSKRPRQVNRHAKFAMMTAAARHVKLVPESLRYYTRKRAEGKGHNQAVRCVGRQLVRIIWSMVNRGRDYQAAYLNSVTPEIDSCQT